MNNNIWTPPATWNNTAPATGGKKLEPGVYLCKILGAEISYSDNGNEKLVIQFDIAQGVYANHYKKQYEKFGGKWKGEYHQMTGVCDSGSINETSLAYFKGFVEAIEAGNKSKWDYDMRWFTGKHFAGVFGEEEYEARDGDIKTYCKLRFIHDANKISELQAPELKRFEPSKKYSSNTNIISSTDYPDNSKTYSAGGYIDVNDLNLPF